ncbi:hypothetical protein V8C37DRAFT_110485 [Trichoderma ceciliae]
MRDEDCRYYLHIFPRERCLCIPFRLNSTALFCRAISLFHVFLACLFFLLSFLFIYFIGISGDIDTHWVARYGNMPSINARMPAVLIYKYYYSLYLVFSLLSMYHGGLVC